jgi:hypothetical protein
VSAIVLIGPPEALSSLGQQFDSGLALQTFTDAQSVAALDHIVRHRPRIVAIEQGFSLTARGEALINRIKSDPSLSECEVRVISAGLVDVRPSTKRKSGAGLRVADAALEFRDERGTRRAARVRMSEGLAVTVDGNPAVLVDLSALGAQVLSPAVLRPNQRVRILLSEGKSGLRCSGAIAWAAFEMPVGLPPRYRAGVRFLGADAEAVLLYLERHKANGSDPDR